MDFGLMELCMAQLVTKAAPMVYLPTMVVVVVIGTVVTFRMMRATEDMEVVAEMVPMHMGTPVLIMEGLCLPTMVVVVMMGAEVTARMMGATEDMEVVAKMVPPVLIMQGLILL